MTTWAEQTDVMLVYELQLGHVDSRSFVQFVLFMISKPKHLGQRNIISRFALRVISGVLGAIVTTLLMVAVFYAIYLLMEYFDISSARIRFPVFLIILPVVGFFAGVRNAPAVHDRTVLLWDQSTLARAVIVLPIFYEVGLLSYIHLFEPNPFRSGLSYLTDSRTELLIELMAFPVVLLFVGLLLVKIITRRNLFLPDDTSG
jgi:hypothetical protein